MSEPAPSLSPKQQWSVRKAQKRLNLWHGAVRSSKTVGSIYRFMQYVGQAPPGDLLLAGKTIDSLKRNIINPMMELLGHEANYSPGKRELKIWDRTIYTVGASDERSEGKIRGSTLAGAYGDELTLWPESFFKMMLSRMSVPGAQFFGTTNPDNPNHWLMKDYIKRKHDLDMTLFHFMLEDNPYLDPTYVEQLKKEYTGLWYKRFILGEWCVAEGAIYDFFDEKKHVIQPKDYPDAQYYDISIDYGTTNPCCFVAYGNNFLTKPKIWSEREYFWDPAVKKKQKTDGEFSADFIQFIRPYTGKIRHIYCDPSAESFQLQLKKDLSRNNIGALVYDADNEVLDGIRTVARMLSEGEYMIGAACKECINEKYAYAWDPKKQDKGEDAPIKKHDHCSDNERYVLYTKFGTKQYDIAKFVN